MFCASESDRRRGFDRTESEIQVGPVQGIDLPPLYVKNSCAFGLKGVFLKAKDALQGKAGRTTCTLSTAFWR